MVRITLRDLKTRANNQWKFNDNNQSILLSAPNEMTLHAGNKMILKTDGDGDSVIKLDVGEGIVNIVAKHVDVSAAESVTVNSGKELIFNSGDKASLSASNDVKIDAGGNIQEKANNTVEVEAKVIKSKANVKNPN